MPPAAAAVMAIMVPWERRGAVWTCDCVVIVVVVVGWYCGLSRLRVGIGVMIGDCVLAGFKVPEGFGGSVYW